MKHFLALLLIVLVVGCAKHNNNCSFPSFSCLQGTWIEKEHTDTSIQLKEYIQVYVKNNREILYDWTVFAQVQTTPAAIGEYYFAELPGEDSVALTPAWVNKPFHRYLKMISENEIEIDFVEYPPIFKKRYIRE